MPCPKVSIIVPVYNKEKYLSDCIESLINQTYANLEIILVDDGSTDDSIAICDKYASVNDRVRVVHQTNAGPSAAWKAGFDISTGEYFSFVDSDDYVASSMVEEMVSLLSGTQGELISSDYSIVKADGSETVVYQTLEPGVYSEEELRKNVIPYLIGNENRLVHVSRCMKLIEKSLIENNRKYCDDKVRMGDDSTIILPIIMDAKRLVIMDHKVFYFYRYIDDSIVHKYDSKAFENNKLHYETLKNMICEKYESDSEMKELMLKSLDKEEIFFLFHIVKNEVKLNYANALKNLTNMRKDSLVARCIKENKVTIKGLDNKLVYSVLRHPSIITVGMLKTAFNIYYR